MTLNNYLDAKLPRKGSLQACSRSALLAQLHLQYQKDHSGQVSQRRFILPVLLVPEPLKSCGFLPCNCAEAQWKKQGNRTGIATITIAELVLHESFFCLYHRPVDQHK